MLNIKDVLEKKLEENKQWVERSGTIVCFVLNDNRWKCQPNRHLKNIIRLSFIGKEEIPTISLDLNS